MENSCGIWMMYFDLFRFNFPPFVVREIRIFFMNTPLLCGGVFMRLFPFEFKGAFIEITAVKTGDDIGAAYINSAA